ncbi:hypothetical protein RCJ22_38965, partial [Vibrio sp. FNV 38]|nr:hypothetical protein [Vibrio sp. FNV 38]
MDIVFFVEVDGVAWKVLSDGSWVEVDRGEVIPQDIPILNATLANETVLQSIEQEEPSETNVDIPEDIARLLDDNMVQSPYSLQASSSSPDGNTLSGSGLILTGYVRSDLSETLAKAGFQTLGSDSSDDERTEITDNTFVLTNKSEISVTITDGGDGYENQFEVPSATIFGTTIGVRDGIAIQVTVTDIEGNEIVLFSEANNDQYRIDGVDLTGLQEGALNVTAVVSDITGNSISSTDDTIKDTIAEIQGGLDGFGDATINQIEQTQDRLFGSVIDVEDGQSIQIQVTDESGLSLQFETVVSNGSWVIKDVDLSTLQDGVLTVISETIDVAGNPAIDTSTINKDTLAKITIQIDDGDGAIDLFEAPSVRLFGNVNEIENGQPVNVIVTDQNGNVLSFQTVVVDQTWEITGADFTSLVDGPLTAKASSFDIAGNKADANDTSQIVLDGTITVDIIDGGDGFENRFEVPSVIIEGTTDNIPDGATILLTITDVDGKQVSTSAVANDGVYRVEGVDIASLAEGDLAVRAEVDGAFTTIEAFDDTV